MTAEELARSFLRQALKNLEQTRALLEERIYHMAFRRSQECVELALKALMRASGVEPPRWHNIGQILTRERSKVPDPARSKAEELADISHFLTQRREKSMYGDEKRGIPAEELISEEDARRAVKGAEFVIETVQASWRFEGA